MRIAQVAPLYERVPPEGYGGTERVVAYLTDALIEQGHQVTLFASGDSITPARLAATCPRSLRLDDSCVDPLAPHLVMLERVFAEAHRFDVVHFHTGFLRQAFRLRDAVIGFNGIPAFAVHIVNPFDTDKSRCCGALELLRPTRAGKSLKSSVFRR